MLLVVVVKVMFGGWWLCFVEIGLISGVDVLLLGVVLCVIVIELMGSGLGSVLLLCLLVLVCGVFEVVGEVGFVIDMCMVLLLVVGEYWGDLSSVVCLVFMMCGE